MSAGISFKWRGSGGRGATEHYARMYYGIQLVQSRKVEDCLLAVEPASEIRCRREKLDGTMAMQGLKK